MLVRYRLRSLEGCVTCKKRRKKCNEAKPICEGCKRLQLRCLWKGDKDIAAKGLSITNLRLTDTCIPKRVRPDRILNASPDLSGYRDLMCGTYVLEKCYDGFNFPVESVWRIRNGTTVRSTLSFAPLEHSLAWGCMVSQGLLMIGNRYHDRRAIEAGMLQQGTMFRRISAAIADENKRHHLDTVAAIHILFMLTGTTVGFTNSGVSNEMSWHGVGFLKVLDTMRPEQFQDEQALALFEHVRFSKVMVSLMLKQETALTSELWKTVPWATTIRTKSSTQRLIDLLCDVASLQADLRSTFPFSKPDFGIDQKDVWEQVGHLLSSLHDWRQSVEPEVRKLSGRSSNNASRGSATQVNIDSQSDTTGIQLYELGMFNLLLIYLCQFLIQNRPLLNTVNIFACDRAQHKSSQHSLESLLSPSVLPLFAPENRIRSAAVEILTICERVHHEAKHGLLLAYLTVPMRVARDILADIGDARSVCLAEFLTSLSEFWSGRSC